MRSGSLPQLLPIESGLGNLTTRAPVQRELRGVSAGECGRIGANKGVPRANNTYNVGPGPQALILSDYYNSLNTNNTYNVGPAAFILLSLNTIHLSS